MVGDAVGAAVGDAVGTVVGDPVGALVHKKGVHPFGYALGNIPGLTLSLHAIAAFS